MELGQVPMFSQWWIIRFMRYSKILATVVFIFFFWYYIQKNLSFFGIFSTQPAFTCSKVDNGNTRKLCEIRSKLVLMTSGQRHWRLYGVFVVNFEKIFHSSDVSIVEFEQANAGWVNFLKTKWFYWFTDVSLYISEIIVFTKYRRAFRKLLNK